MTTFSQVDPDLLFPDSDGKPMAENTEQFRWIVMIKENLEILFATDPNVFVAGDLLWYPVRSTLIPATAPDVMVVFGRPKGRRGSYRQWQEENIPVQIVFEILSPSNDDAEMTRKAEFYDTYGVEEYYLYDPDTFRFEIWLRQNDRLEKVSDRLEWVSPRLKIRFVAGQEELKIYRPNGQPFLSSIELDQRAEQERQRAEQERQRAEAAEARAKQMEELLARYREQFGDLPPDP